MNEKQKETLEKQLELLLKCSENTASPSDLPDLTKAMCEIISLFQKESLF